MDIEITRRWKGANTTLSTVKVDGNAHHFVLEDVDRGLKQNMKLAEISKIKVKARTAIPEGRYPVIVTYSNRFKRLLPLLTGVPGYEGIRIHPGNTHENTEGCLLPGVSKEFEAGDYRVISSRTAFEKLFEAIQSALKADQKVYCTIKSQYA